MNLKFISIQRRKLLCFDFVYRWWLEYCVLDIDNFCDDIAIMLGKEWRPGKYIGIHITTYSSCNYILFSNHHHHPWNSLYICLFICILSRCNTRWLYISNMGTCAWLDGSNNMSRLASIYVFRWNLSLWSMQCMFTIYSSRIISFFIDH
jgi:hypothetical protein